MNERVRALLAIWVGKLAIWVSRALRWGGSTLPGRVAFRLDPGVLRRLGAQPRLGNLIVSGTNGKTTTASMLAEVCHAAGYRVVHNRAGANLAPGLAAAFIGAATWRGRIDADFGLMEVDEASVARAGDELRPGLLLVTNFFRDQLDRFGELTHTVEHVRRGIAHVRPSGWIVLNADDPLAASLAPATGADDSAASVEAAADVRLPAPRVLYYGIEDESLGRDGHGGPGAAADARHCVRCGAPYRYAAAYYAHLGRYSCPACGLRRPQPEVRLLRLEREGERGSRLQIATPQGDLVARISVPGVYNAYNALAAAAAGVALGLSPAQIAAGLQSFSSAFGRMETVQVGDRRIALALVKNPAGFDAVLRTVLEIPGTKRLMIAINDRFADGTDVSWLWDVDFEQLAAPDVNVAEIVCSGVRAEDMAVRLKYAGVPQGKLVVENDLRRAIDLGLAITPPGETLHLLPTYTAMLEAREALARIARLPRFWEV